MKSFKAWEFYQRIVIMLHSAWMALQKMDQKNELDITSDWCHIMQVISCYMNDSFLVAKHVTDHASFASCHFLVITCRVPEFTRRHIYTYTLNVVKLALLNMFWKVGWAVNPKNVKLKSDEQKFWIIWHDSIKNLKISRKSLIYLLVLSICMLHISTISADTLLPIWFQWISNQFVKYYYCNAVFLKRKNISIFSSFQ